jgi:hypothetical protein
MGGWLLWSRLVRGGTDLLLAFWLLNSIHRIHLGVSTGWEKWEEERENWERGRIGRPTEPSEVNR